MPRLPAHWGSYRLKSKVSNVIEALESHVGDDLKYIALEQIESWTGKVRYINLTNGSTSQLKKFERNDVLFSKLRPYLAKVVLALEGGGCVGELLVLRSKDSLELDQKYLAHFLRAKPIIDAIDGSTFGAKMPRASWDFIGNLLLPLPPPDEQAAIVKYLDHMTRRIDKAIRAKKKLIQLLNEQKQVIIHQAVTKGLDPNVSMKDSGVPWLGEVPEHWEVRRTKRHANIKTGGKDTIDRKFNGEFPFYVRSQKVERIDSYSFDGEAVLTAGDGVGVARVFHYANGKFDYHQRVYKFSDFKEVVGKFFYYYIGANLKFEALALSAKSTVDSIRLPMLQNFPLALPTIQEQLEIVGYIENASVKSEKSLELLKKEISLLEEYRTRLIADVVTGQIDVRELASQLPDEQEDVEPFELDDVEEEILETEQDE